MSMRGLSGLAVIVVVGIGALLVFGRGGGIAPKPAAFAGTVLLDEALSRSAAEGRPVLVFATADWCGPCQSLKRGALASAKLEQTIRSSTIPVYADVTGDDAPSMEAAQRLGVGSIPALILVWNGREVARHEGNASAPAIEKWLDAALAAARSAS